MFLNLFKPFVLKEGKKRKVPAIVICKHCDAELAIYPRHVKTGNYYSYDWPADGWTNYCSFTCPECKQKNFIDIELNELFPYTQKNEE